VISHLFDDRVMAAGEVTSARVIFGGASVTTCTRYFEFWMRMALPSAQVSIERTDGRPGLRSIALSTASNSLSITRRSDHNVEVEGCGRHYRSLLPPVSEEALMREELGILGRDSVYEQVLGE